jgi:glycine betaine transporter
MKSKIRPVVFWPSFIILIAAVIFSLTNLETFSSTLSKVTVWSMGFFGAGYELLTVIMMFVCIAVFLMPFGRVRIGGGQAKSPYGLFSYFTMCLAMTVATGILFWGALEHIFHVTQPPASYGITPGSPESAIFAMSTIFLHWTFTPYAIYGVPTVLFAFVYYNMKKSFTVSSMLSPILGDKSEGRIGQIVDSIIVLAMVCGVATTLGVGTMMITGGLRTVLGIPSNIWVWLCVCGGIVLAFVISAIAGISDGLKHLAKFNFYIFMFLLGWVIVFGSALYCINLGLEGFGDFLGNFFQKNFFTGAAASDQWPVWWTIWYYAIWMAWAPVSAVFLGRISYGYKVRTVIGINVFISALFSVIWFTFFSGTAIHMEIVQQLGLGQVLATQGNEMVTYAFFAGLPLGKLISGVFVITAFITFVAGADAMCATLAGLSTYGISPDNPESSRSLKIIWGVVLGAVAWITMSFAGLDGLKALSNLGGIPTLILLVPVTWALIKVAANPFKYDTFKEDYDVYGQPKREIVNLLAEANTSTSAEAASTNN